jgi:hypothetical protein
MNYMDAETRNQLIDSYFSAMDDAEFDKLEDVLTEDVTYLMSGAELSGVDSVKQVFESGQMSNTTHDASRRFHSEGVSICEGSFSADVAGRGHMEGDFTDIIEFDKDTGKISRVAIYTRE